MKNMKKKLTAALLAITYLPISVFPAVCAENENSLWYWGIETGNPFDNMEHIDTLSGLNLSGSRQGEKHETYLRTTVRDDGTTFYTLYTVTSRDRFLRFRLRDGLNENSVISQVLAVLEKYYPGLTANYQPGQGAIVPADATDYRYADYMFHSIGDASFEIRDCRPEQPAQALGDSIRKELAARGLITEFYNWGQTGDYQLIYPSSTSLLTYEKYRSEIIGENDLTPLIGYLAEHYPDYKLESVKIENSKNEYFQVIPSKELTFPEQIRLMGELYQATHIMSNFDYDIPESIEGIGVAIGSNDMEYLGDTTLDCEVDIIDVIAVNKHILGIKALDKIAAKNADMNGNGEIEPDDSLAILKTVLSDEE